MNALCTFDLFYGLYTRMYATAKNYEIIHADTRYCTRRVPVFSRLPRKTVV
jgi:hypothetical protein